MKELHVVLGGNGVIGQAVVAELANQKLPYRYVGRQDIKNPHYVKADLLELEQMKKAVKDATHVYVCVGLPYITKFWKHHWPIMMTHMVSVLSKTKARVIFLDNTYLYGPKPLSIPFDETHLKTPRTKKGKIRKQVVDYLFRAHQDKKIKLVIGRAADFFGPKTKTSVLYSVFLENMLRDKPPLFLGSYGVPHTYAYTEDIGKALVMLGRDHEAYGNAWHLPVYEPKNIEDIAEAMNHVLNTEFEVKTMSTLNQRMLGLMVPILRELREMRYLFDQPHVMDSSRFYERYPDFVMTPFEDAIQKTVKSFPKPKIEHEKSPT